MKKLFTILAFILSVLATIIAVSPKSNFAIYPVLAALISGFIAFYLSKKTGEVKKITQFSILLTLLALGLVAFKAFFIEAHVSNIEAIEPSNTEESSNKKLEIDKPELNNLNK